MKTRLTALLSISALLVASACSSDDDDSSNGSNGDDGRPSVSEISAVLQAGAAELGSDLDGEGLSQETADCMAEALHSSELSNEALQAMIEGNQAFDSNAQDQGAFMAIFGDIMQCALDEFDLGDLGDFGDSGSTP